PIRNVNAAHGVSHRAVFELVRGEPPAAVPLPDHLANAGFSDLDGQETFRRKCLLDLFVRHQRGGAAEIATLADARRIKDRNRLATLAANRGLLRLPAAFAIGDAPKRGNQIVFLDDFLAARRQFGVCGRDRAAIGTNQRLLRWIPLRLRAAGWAGEFLAGGGGRHGLPVIRIIAQLFKYSSSATRVMRHAEPIFLPFNEPSASVDRTSASLTPRTFAT